MSHPSLAALLAPDAETARHLAGCAECARLVEVAAAPVRAEEPRYERFEEAHRGGMGRTVRARDRVLDREVLLKELRAPPELTVSQLRRRFEREARLTAQLVHPAILPVYDLGENDDGSPFYAMPHIAGRTLAEVFADTPPDRRVALVPAITAVAEAVAFAHERGVVHRDLKPENVLVGEHGQVVVIDWGLAAVVGERADVRGGDAVEDGLTRLGVGTPAYMSPEQAAGAPADRRQDVYGIGATLHHALAGARPWAARGPETIRATLAAPAPGPGPLPRGTPPELVSVVQRAMATDPADRYPDAGTLAADLRRFLDGRLLDTHRYSALDRAARWARRNRGALGALGAAVVAVAVVAAVSLREVWASRDHAEAALEASLAAQARLLAADPHATADALVAALGAIEVGGPDPSDDARAALSVALGAGPAARRIPEISGWGVRDVARGAVWLAEPSGRLLRVGRDGTRAVPLSVGHPWNLVLTPSGRRWAVIGDDRRVEVGDDAVTSRFTAPLGGRWIRWLDEERLVILEERALAVVDRGGQVQARVTVDHPADRLEVRDGIVWVGARDGSVFRVNAASVERRAPPRGVAVSALAIADGERVFVGYADGEVRDPTGSILGSVGASIETLQLAGDCLAAVPHDAPLWTFALGPRCATRAYAGTRNGLLRADGAVLFALEPERACVRDPRDGRELSCVAAPEGLTGGGFVDDRLSYLIGFGGLTWWDASERLRPHAGAVVALAAAGSVALSAGRDGGVQVDDPAAGVSREVARLAGGVSAAAVHPRGLVAGAFDGELALVGVGGPIARARLRDGIGAVAVSGERIWTGTLDGAITEHGPDLGVVRAWESPSGVRGLVLVPTGPELDIVALGLDGAARRYSAAGELRGAIGGPDRPIGLAAPAPGGAVWVRERDHTARWSLGGPEDPAPLDGRLVGAWPDGRVVTARADGLVRVFGPDGAPLSAWPGEIVRPRGLSATGRVLGGDGAVFEADGRLALTSGAAWVEEVALDGWLVAGAVDGSIRAEPLRLPDAVALACDRLRVVGAAAPSCVTAP